MLPKSLFVLLIILSTSLLFFLVVYSISYQDYTTSLNCSTFWNGDCNSTINDAFAPCNGVQFGTTEHIVGLEINATAFRPDDAINITCNFWEINRTGNTRGTNESFLYYNTSHWIVLNSSYFSPNTIGRPNNVPNSVSKSIIFKSNLTEGYHIVRCLIGFNSTDYTSLNENYCPATAFSYDVDDVNFTVVTPLEYYFWNLVNATTASSLGNGFTATRNSTINITINYTKLVNFTYLEHNGNGTFVNYTILNGNQAYWVNYTLNLTNSTEFNNYNITFRIYSDDVGFWGFNKTSTLLYFYLDPGNPPNASLTGFTSGSNSITTANLFDGDVYVKALVQDDVGLSSVIAQIFYPNGNYVNASMTGINNPGHDETWSFNFNSTIPLNVSGVYKARVISIDIGGQENVTENDTLTANNTYILTSLPDTVYNRGENVSVTVYNVRGDSIITAYNWTMDLTIPNNTIANLIGINSQINYTIKNYDPIGSYNMTGNATKLNNTGNNTYQFSVNNTLIIYFTQPTEHREDYANVRMSDPKVKIYNARNESLNYAVASINLTCPNGNFTLTKTGDEYYNSSAECRYSPSVGTFLIIVNASDIYNNTGSATLSLTTISAEGGTTIISGGSGGGGSGTEKNTTIIINNTANATQQLTRDFNFTLSSSSVEIEQGQDATIIGSLFNIGNQPLVLNATLESKCCNITLPKGFELGVKKEAAFSINIHVPLFQDLGEYVVNVSLSTSGITKEKAFKIIVKKSTSINSLNELEQKLSNLESQVAEYEKLGMDVNDLKRMIENIKQLLSGGKSSINRDSSDSLKNSLDNANKIISSLSSKLPTLGLQKFLHQNKYNIGLALTTIVLTTYTATQVIYPYHKLSQELKFLTEEEAALVQSRKDAEKQFFKRIINEQAFTNIMITKQEKVLKTRAMLKLKQEEKAGLVKSKLSPKTFVGWIKNGSINTFYSIKSSPRNIVDKIKSKMKREEVKSY